MSQLRINHARLSCICESRPCEVFYCSTLMVINHHHRSRVCTGLQPTRTDDHLCEDEGASKCVQLDGTHIQHQRSRLLEPFRLRIPYRVRIHRHTRCGCNSSPTRRRGRGCAISEAVSESEAVLFNRVETALSRSAGRC